MNVIYRCPKCNKIIDHIELESFDERTLGLNILTQEEKEDIIEVESNNIYIDLTCDECEENYDWQDFIKSQQIH